MARGVTSIIVETLLTGKLATASLNFFDKARAGLKTTAHELAKAPQTVATAAEGINVQESIAQKASDKLFDFMEKGSQKVKNHDKINLSKQVIEKPLDYTHNMVQYEKLKKALKIEEITSIITVTEHGLERLIERGFIAEEIHALITNPDFIKTQLDGAKTFIKKAGERYNLIVINEQSHQVVTALRNISLKKVQNLGNNYGWQI